MDKKNKIVALIVAHPDDETLWAGGTILNNPNWQWFIASTCRGSDKDRAPKFYKVLKFLKSDGVMGDMDDGPDQIPLNEKEVENTILQLLPQNKYDLIITHNISGEYSRHLRHEEVGKAVINLWHSCKISTKKLWVFAYEDENKKYYPKPVNKANIYYSLTDKIWQKKYNIITKMYGFAKNSFEAKTTPKAEAFWEFISPNDAKQWTYNKEIK